MNPSTNQGRYMLAGPLVGLMAGLTVSCGGGGQVAGIDGGGIGPATAIGGITGFGSVIVNDVQFETDNSTTITLNGQPGIEAALRVGQIVTVDGTINGDGRTGRAESIRYDDSLKGPITDIDAALGEITVLGQLVRVDATTIFDNSSINPPGLAGLAVGQIVEVSGYPAPGGATVASRIERKAPGTGFEITGVVSNLTGSTFRINGLTVNYASVVVQNGLLANGGCAEAKGTGFDTGTATLVATQVEVKSCGTPGAVNSGGRIEGIVTSVASRSGNVLDFNIGAQRITTSEATTVENGTAATVDVNVKVQAEGRFNSAGVLVASKIKIKPSGNLRVDGVIQVIDAGASTVTVLGVTISVNSSTRLEDDTDAAGPFSFASLRVGDYVEVRGFSPADAPASAIIASRLERDDVRNRQSLRGFLPANPDPGNLALLGVAISVNGSTEYRAVDDSPIPNLTQFLDAALAAGGLIEARCRDDRGECTPTFVAEQLEVELP